VLRWQCLSCLAAAAAVVSCEAAVSAFMSAPCQGISHQTAQRMWHQLLDVGFSQASSPLC